MEEYPVDSCSEFQDRMNQETIFRGHHSEKMSGRY
jgi:hypothetical protein